MKEIQKSYHKHMKKMNDMIVGERCGESVFDKGLSETVYRKQMKLMNHVKELESVLERERPTCDHVSIARVQRLQNECAPTEMWQI